MILENIKNRAKLKKAIRNKEVEKMNQLLLTTNELVKHVDEVPDVLLMDLDKDVLLRKVDGYLNLYDYLLKTRNVGFRAKELKKDVGLGLTYLLNKNLLIEDEYTDELLLTKLDNGLVLDYAIKNEAFIIGAPVVRTIELAEEILKRKQYSLLGNATIDVLRHEVEPGKTIFDVLIENKAIPRIKYIERAGLDLCQIEPAPILFEKIRDGKTVIDLLLESDLPISFSVNDPFFDKNKQDWGNIFIYCLSNKKLDRITEVPEAFLTMSVPNGENNVLFVELFCANGYMPRIIGMVKDPRVIKSLWLYHSYNKLDCSKLIYQCDTNALLTKISDNLRFIDFVILQAIEKNNIPSLVRILYNSGKMTEEISLAFAQFDIFLTPIDRTQQLGLNKDDAIASYLYKNSILESPREYKEFIDRFKEAFSGEENDKETIDSIVRSFNDTVINSPEESVRDIEALLELKRQNSGFKITCDPKNGSFFSAPMFNNPGILSVQNKDDLSALNHEWGHAIHSVYGGGKTPEEFEVLIPYDIKHSFDDSMSLSNLFSIIGVEASQYINDESYEEAFKEFVNDIKGGLEAYKQEIRDDYKRLIGSSEILIEAIKTNKFSQEVLQALADVCFGGETPITDESMEEYVKERIKAEFKQFKDKKYERDNSEFLCYENFIDAYYFGILGDLAAILPTNAPTCTHNSFYFVKDDSQFREMFANYVSLRKAPDGKTFINKLKEHTSPELIDALENYYLSIGKSLDKRK